MRLHYAVLMLAGLSPSCGSSGEATDRAVFELRDLDTQEAEFVRLLNEYRGTRGLPALVATRLLNQVAYDHSLDMGTRRYFDHVNRSGLSPFDRMRAAGYPYGNAENIAAGNSDARRTFEQWRTSSGHNANMLNTSSRAIGIGRAYVPGSSYRYYWTNVFGTVVDSSGAAGSAPPPAPPPPPAGACASGLAGSGANGGSGSRCLAQYQFNVEAGRSYVVSTCGRSSGDTYLVVTGACNCTNDDFCELGSECRCTATTTGVASLCASTYANQTASWSYAVSSSDGGRCSVVGAPPTPPPPPPPPPDAGTVVVDSSVPSLPMPPQMPPRDSGSPLDVLYLPAPDATAPVDVSSPPLRPPSGTDAAAPDGRPTGPATLQTIRGACRAAPPPPGQRPDWLAAALCTVMALRRRGKGRGAH